MSKNYRVKRYYGKGTTSYRAKPHPVTIILVVLLFAGLGYFGTVIYKPVYNFVMNIGKETTLLPTEPVLSEPESVSSEPAEPEPEPEPEPEFDKLRAVYIPTEIAMDSSRLAEFLDGLAGTEINAVMLDIKNDKGDVLFKSKNQMANKWGAIDKNAIDLQALARTLESKDLALIAKMSAFRDQKAASAGRLAYAINYQNSDFLWLDNSPENGGKPWLNPYSIPTQDYIDDLAMEAVDAGAKMIVLENFQFPDNSGVYASFGKDAATLGRSEILKLSIDDLAAHAKEKNARIAVLYSASEAARSDGQENRYGGPLLDIPREYFMLNVSISQFGNNYSLNGLEISDASDDPVNAVKTAIDYVKRGLSSETAIIPVIQGGNAGAGSPQSYTAEQVDAQIKAAGELGLSEYVLYDAGGNYLIK